MKKKQTYKKKKLLEVAQPIYEVRFNSDKLYIERYTTRIALYKIKILVVLIL